MSTEDEWDEPEAKGPLPGSVLDCGCHIRRPRYDVALCDEHAAEVAEPTR